MVQRLRYKPVAKCCPQLRPYQFEGHSPLTLQWRAIVHLPKQRSFLNPFSLKRFGKRKNIFFPKVSKAEIKVAHSSVLLSLTVAFLSPCSVTNNKVSDLNDDWKLDYFESKQNPTGSTQHSTHLLFITWVKRTKTDILVSFSCTCMVELTTT